MEKVEGDRIWGCSKCFWIHRADVAKALLEAFEALGIATAEELEERRSELKGLFVRLKAKYPPKPGK